MNQIVKGKCIDISFEGKGVCKTELGIVFVDNCFIGEEAEIEILYKRAGNYFGKIKNLIVKSKERIQPKCKICSSCGGCQYQQISYNAQLEYKTNKVKDVYNDLKKTNNDVYMVHKTVYRPWGFYKCLEQGEGFLTKLIHVSPRQQLSYQMHNFRSEHWVVLSGKAKILLEDKEESYRQQ